MLKNKRIVVVGGSSGIGLNLATQLLNQGNEVIIGSRSSEKRLEATKGLHGEISSLQVDASDGASVIRFFDEIGTFDHLVVTIKPEHLTCTFEKSDILNTRQAFDSKFWGQYNLVRHCLKNISAKGSIVLTSGIASKRSYSGFTGIAAINGAIESFVRSVSAEISPIRVNVVSPGFIEQHQGDVHRYKSILKLGASPSLKRLGTQNEVSQAYIYLMENTYSTGSTLIIDGGELST